MKALLLSLLLLTMCGCGREPATHFTVEAVEKDQQGCWCLIRAASPESDWFWFPCADSVKVGTTVTLQFIYE